MKLKPLLIVAMLVLGVRACMAQVIVPDIISSTGNCFFAPDFCLSWTLGEPLSETDVSSSGNLTQGFQQPTSIIVTNVNNVSSQGNVSVYPNPFTSSFYLKNNGAGKILQVELTDMAGKTVFRKNMTTAEEGFDLTGLSNGIYFLRVYNTDNQLIQTLKVDKIK